ncbi:MAG: IS4 family transposase [Chloroflexota bacterium]
MEAIEAAVPRATVEAVVADLGVAEQRRRKLPAQLTVLLAIAMNLFTHHSLEEVLRRLLKGLRFIWPDPDIATANKGAISMARYRLGATPLVELFHRVCKPMATEQTHGAFLFGLRVMAFDGTNEDLPDTPDNARVFGRPGGNRGDGAFPQAKGFYLLECGTHAVVDAGFWPCRTGEDSCAHRLLRSVTEGMLLMWDTGLHSFDLARDSRARGAHFLDRVPANVKFQPIWRLSDGSYLTYIYPSQYQRRRKGEHLLVRVVDYTLTDPALPGYGETHRLMTSLLDPDQCPATELACAYHERWEVELAIDEMDTHQKLAQHPLRSKKPVGVIQELYALLIAHYVVRHTMHEAALQEDLDPDRLSFTKAVSLICDAIPEFQMAVPEQHAALYRRLLGDIARQLLPKREGRSNPRVVKRKMSNFRLKRAEHQHWPQPSVPFREAVAVSHRATVPLLLMKPEPPFAHQEAVPDLK